MFGRSVRPLVEAGRLLLRSYGGWRVRVQLFAGLAAALALAVVLTGRAEAADRPVRIVVLGDSLTAGLRIGNCDLEVGSEWWLDKYFRWWFVFKPECVARSLAGDHSWVGGFLRARSSAGRKRAGRRRSRT